jgi:hypothetical protein
MSTRSRIAIATTRGYQSIYCHSDGYPEYNGRILLEHYTDPDKVRALIALGDLSILEAEIGIKHPFSMSGLSDEQRDEYDRLYSTMCVAYGRDRGDSGIDAQSHKTFADLAQTADDCHARWLYLYRNGRWFFAPVSRSLTRARMRPLTADAVTATV